MFPSDRNHDKWISNLRHLETSLYPTCPVFAWSHFGTRLVSETAFAFFCLRFLFFIFAFSFFLFCLRFLFFICGFFLLCVWAFYTKQYLSYLPYLTCFMQPNPCPWGVAQSSVIATRFSSLFLGFRCRYGASELHPVASFIGGNKLTLGAKFHYCNSITT